MFLIYDEFFWPKSALMYPARLMFVLVSFELFVFSLTGLLAIWGGLGRSHWFVRAMVVLGGLSLWSFVPAYEPMLVFFTQTAVAVSLLAWARYRRATEQSVAGVECSEPPGRNVPGAHRVRPRSRHLPQFTLRDMLLWTAVAAVFSAAAAQVTSDVWHDCWKYLPHGTAYGLLTAAAAWVVFGRCRWWLRAVGGCLAFPSALIVGWLLLGRWSGLFGEKPPARAAFRYTARIGLAAVSLLLVLPSAFVYYQLATPVPIPVVELPEPNGYDDLLRAGEIFDNVTVPEKADGVDVLRSFVQKHASALQIARTGLDRDCRVQPLYGSFDVRIEQLQNHRQLSRVFRAEALLAEAEGRTEDAMQSHYDILRLSSAVARGGLLLDRLVGRAILGMAISGLNDLSDELSPKQCEEVVDVLEMSQTDWEPIEECWPREDVWQDHVFGWRGRLGHAAGLVRDTRSVDEKRAEYGAPDLYGPARVRLLIGTLAIRRYRLERGELPGTLADLVPEYLPAVPEDPFNGQPLIYRRTGNEYVLYSIGRDRVDDGGQRAESEDESYSDKDLMLYTSPDDG